MSWLVAGRFGLGARGKTLTLTRADFNEALEKRGLSVTATIPDRVGAGDTRAVTLKIGSLKDFSLKNVIASVPELGELLAKSEAISKLKDPSAGDLEGILGKGKLLDSLRAALEPAAAPVGGAAGAASGDAEAIFEKGAVQEKSAKSAIDMFVRSTSSSSRTKAKPAARQLRDLVEQAAYGVAADVLRAPEVEAVEAAWRGLRFLLSECPKESGMRVILLETDPAHLVEDLAARERGDDIDEPDCVFVPHDFDAAPPILALAELAEQELIPVVVGVSPRLFAAEHPQALPDAFEALERARNDELPEWAARWDELRMSEATRWVCAVANRVALHVEGAGEAKRALFASGVWAVAAMTAASYRTTGGFARIFGKAGSLRAPATHTIEKGAVRGQRGADRGLLRHPALRDAGQERPAGRGQRAQLRRAHALEGADGPRLDGRGALARADPHRARGALRELGEAAAPRRMRQQDRERHLHERGQRLPLPRPGGRGPRARGDHEHRRRGARRGARGREPEDRVHPVRDRLPAPARLERARARGRHRAGEPRARGREGGRTGRRGEGRRRQGRRRRPLELERRLRRRHHEEGRLTAVRCGPAARGAPASRRAAGAPRRAGGARASRAPSRRAACPRGG
ncbi:MAG: type VI secretion system contractile sheath small subunit [Sandaracinaceae bacterium]|nr:type VI secretion system contractile sheath small subunit [Sandaracinaceae bacterium]